MTLKQGQDINRKFTELNSEIITLRDSLNSKNNKIIDLSTETNKLKYELNTMSSKSIELNKQNVVLTETIENNEKLFLSERRKWAGWMFFSVVVTVMMGVLK